MSTRHFDFVVYGATGVTGRQAAAYLCDHAPSSARIGIAGRRVPALEQVAATLSREVEILQADSHDPDSLHELAPTTHVLLAMAGPYVKFGDPVVDACVAHGTDYVDITGETPWVRSLIDRHHDAARRQGTRIVPCCGFDSVPADLGLFALAEHCRERGQRLGAVRGLYKLKGGFNGGTFTTMLTLGDPKLGRRIADPTLLVPDGDRSRCAPDPRSVSRDPGRGTWLAPFVMGPINTRVVRRSQALLTADGGGYGDAFRYQEYLEVGRGLGGRVSAWGMTLAFGALNAAVRKPAWREVLRRMGPKPGEGPSEAEMDGGFFRLDLVGVTEDGHAVSARVGGQGDPGNRITVKCVCEGALALRYDRDRLPDAAGVITPATALGTVGVERLRTAGMHIDVDPA